MTVWLTAVENNTKKNPLFRTFFSHITFIHSHTHTHIRTHNICLCFSTSFMSFELGNWLFYFRFEWKITHFHFKITTFSVFCWNVWKIFRFSPFKNGHKHAVIESNACKWFRCCERKKKISFSDVRTVWKFSNESTDMALHSQYKRLWFTLLIVVYVCVWACKCICMRTSMCGYLLRF